MINNISNQLLESIIADFSDGNLSNYELQVFSELQNKEKDIRKTARAGMRMRNLLRQLKPVGTSKGFDQRMSANFALELENEVKRNNQKRINSRNRATTS